MPSIDTNAIQGGLQVYAYKTLPAFGADLPPRDMWTENFDDSIANEGTAVHTSIATSQFGNSLNNLANGWEETPLSSSDISTVLTTLGHDHLINVTTWATVGEQHILNLFSNILSKQVANGIFVNVANNVTSSVYTNTITVDSSSVFPFTGSDSLQAASELLDELEIPQAGRYGIVNPKAYQSLTGQLYQQYVWGDPTLVRNNGFSKADGSPLNSANPGLFMGGFNMFKQPRINTTTAKKPYGGAVYGNSDKLVGFVGNKAGIVVAARTPIPQQVPLYYSVVVNEPTSGWPIQYIMAFDISEPGWRFGMYSLFGSSRGNTNAIVPILARFA